MSAPDVAAFALAVIVLTVNACRHGVDENRRSGRLTFAGVELEVGDLIFRRTNGPLGTMVLVIDRASPFSHVGIVAFVAPDVVIVHAAPASDEHAGGVTRTSLAEFISATDVTGAAVYRVRPTNRVASERAAAWALDQAQRRIPFDGALNLSDTTAVYCTELVWRAYQKAGVVLVDLSSSRPSVPLVPDTVLFVSALVKSQHLVLVAHRNTY